MKKIALLAIFALFSNAVSSQQWNGNSTPTDNISRDGKVSVGTSQSIDKLNVSGGLRMLNGTVNFGYTQFPAASMNSFFSLGYVDHGSSNLSSGLYLYPMSTDFVSIDISTGMTLYPESYKAFHMDDVGRIGMGTVNFGCSDCNNYRLFVKDGILTEKVKVNIAANNNWADYVFNKDYKLMPLKDLKSFISENGHLPEVPTTDEAIKNGIELKEMNILLLKKVEELTLYTIQQQNQLEAQSKRIEQLESKVKSNPKH